MAEILLIQRFVRLQRSHSRFLTIPIVRDIHHNTRNFDDFQKIMLERQTRVITYRFLCEIMRHSPTPISISSYSKWVSMFLSAFLIHTFPDDVLSTSRSMHSERAVLQSASSLVRRVCIRPSAKVCHISNDLYVLFQEYCSRFDTWLLEDRQCQLNVLCQLIVQLRTHGPNTTNKNVRNEYVKSAQAFESNILEHIRKISGESGIEFVKQFIGGVEKAQLQIASQVNTTMHRVYWDMMEEQLANSEHRVTCVIMLVKELVKELLLLVTSDEYRRNVQEDIDIAYLELKMMNGTFSIDVLGELVDNVCKHILLICSPAQDAEIKAEQKKIEKHLREPNCTWKRLGIFFKTMTYHVQYVKDQVERLHRANQTNDNESK